MNAKRTPQTPPDLPGFTYVDVLGSGGFADVYLYEQQLPKRRVAVKVLLTERMSSGSVAEFTAEANVMAMLSTHPAIVTIYQAGVAGDGRPYLVMEYCPKPNLQVRYRREPFSIAESLRVGVQVAAAVETAHRAGVLHRDIKPANILVTEYNRPALTDFGIASTTSAAAESAGLSIPWSPPESFADSPRSEVRSDVYALGATVYTLLAGRSPFEQAGRRNTAAELIERIETAPLPPLDRADVPASLHAVLARAMAKSVTDRYENALAFARALQKVQIELSHSVTPIDILDDGATDEIVEDEDDGLTRVRGVVSIHPETNPAAGLTRPSATTAPSRREPYVEPDVEAPDDTVLRADATAAVGDTVLRPASGPAAPPVPSSIPGVATPAQGRFDAIDETVLRAPTTAPVPRPEPPAPSRKGLVIGLVAAAAVVVVAVVLAVSLPALLGGTPDAAPTPPATSAPKDPVSAVVAPPADLAGAPAANGVEFTWTNPDPQEGDKYLVGVVTRADQDPELEAVTESSVTVPADASGTTCIEVMVVRTNGQSSDPAKGCVP
ncbi:protein kinase domain-containing protein [Microbacterium immunditiarum]|uniref:non-specific serine/threonine protein kinase n=1 Tax=Microbacterium immunditiarum TaxID=337480 RepID=A0A7Y9GLK3_9MICO|nr:serine/threonine protein kinase [Microbacterium immunditiarum]